MIQDIKNVLYEERNSPIHGRGLYAAEDIPKGARIIEYVGEKITKAESFKRAEEWDNHARTQGFGLVYIFELNKRYDIDGNIPNNPAKYINHNCKPNCEAQNIRGRIWVIALRAIKKGEELSYDYGYDIDYFMEHPCLCSAQGCVGYIVRKNQRKKVQKILDQKASLIACI